MAFVTGSTSPTATLRRRAVAAIRRLMPPGTSIRDETFETDGDGASGYRRNAAAPVIRFLCETNGMVSATIASDLETTLWHMCDVRMTSRGGMSTVAIAIDPRPIARSNIRVVLACLLLVGAAMGALFAETAAFVSTAA